jgi:aminopeptidase-like protein
MENNPPISFIERSNNVPNGQVLVAETMETTNTELLRTSRTKGHQMYELMEELYPICRSITGDGVRETLGIVKSHIPLTMHKIRTGATVFDWQVPKEWNIRDAYIKNSRGEKIVDFAHSNLHVLNYSIPVHQQMPLSELRKHLYTLPEYPDWIPYRTSYYKEDWGFCITHSQFLRLQEDTYEVVIDSTLKKGHLTYGEYFLPGELNDEVLLSTHICHPSLCNDNLSGISVLTFLAKYLQTRKLRYSYRFLFIPGTIGAIAWLSINEVKTMCIKHGLVATLLGDSGPFTYKKSRRGNADIDKIVPEVLRSCNVPHRVINYSPYGYDERQFCSPGFNLPVGSLTRTPYGQYPEYHTSADNLDFVKPEALDGSLKVYQAVINMLEANQRYINTNPKCEPQLGRRKLYSLTGGNKESADFQMATLWVLNLSDGFHSLMDISKESGLPFELITEVADKLKECRLLSHHPLL